MPLPQIISCCNDREFRRFSLPFIASINTHSPGQDVCIYVMNPGPDLALRAQSLIARAQAVTLRIAGCDTAHDNGEQRLALLQQHRRKHGGDSLFLDISLIIKQDLLLVFNQLHGDLVRQSGVNRHGIPRVLWLHRDYRRRHKPRALDETYLSRDFFDASLLWQRSTSPDKAQVDAILHRCCQDFCAGKNVAVLMRRLDQPFKPGIGTTRESCLRRIGDSTRLYWQYFPKLLRDACARAGQRPELICRPMDELDQAFVSTLPHEFIYFPHGNRHQYPDDRLCFYMQDIYPFFFTLDRSGWGATSSRYGQNDWDSPRDCQQADAFCQRVKHEKITKYQQKSAIIPEFDVFFPLQIPDDESLRFGSPHALRDIVHAVAAWAEQRRVRVLFKCHPVRPSLDYLKLNNRSAYVHVIRTGDVHDLLARAPVVFVANSGVGFEAMVHFKPVVTFARALYDVMTIAANPEIASIDAAYNRACEPIDRKPVYLRFIQWYLFEAGSLLSQPDCLVDLPQGPVWVDTRACHQEMARYRRHPVRKKWRHFLSTNTIKNTLSLIKKHCKIITNLLKNKN